MKRAIVLLLSISLAAGAAELEVGRQYAPGTRIEASAEGVAFTVPDEWLGGLPPGSAAFLFGSNTRAGLGLVMIRAAA